MGEILWGQQHGRWSVHVLTLPHLGTDLEHNGQTFMMEEEWGNREGGVLEMFSDSPDVHEGPSSWFCAPCLVIHALCFSQPRPSAENRPWRPGIASLTSRQVWIQLSPQPEVVRTHPDARTPSRVPCRFKWRLLPAELDLRSHLPCFIFPPSITHTIGLLGVLPLVVCF